MGSIKGFMENERETPPVRPVEERLQDQKECYAPFPEEKYKKQGARCMDCGVPFCQSETGCPLGNLIPDWNDMVYRGRYKEAVELLLKTNNFPEFTGRICPAPCEGACVLGINEPAVTICNIEEMIAEKGFELGYIKSRKPEERTEKKIAVVGSGPAGLACAAQLNSAGHEVTVFEKEDRIGGLLMYGIPNFKLDKVIVKRRLKLMEEEGVIFKTGVNIGVDKSAVETKEGFKVADLSLAAWGRREIDLAQVEMPGLMALRSRHQSEAPRRRPHHGQPAHDGADRGADRNPRRTRRRRALGVLQHLFDPGPCRCCSGGRTGRHHRGAQRHPGVRMDGGEPRGILGMHGCGDDMAGWSTQHDSR